MGRVVAGIYEIEREIGSGGGGIVYLARHLRLMKLVVLKADRRTLKAGTEVLRREVDILKRLNNTYLPQVYDFVQEDGVVYTVMDYVEGESLDKVIKRGIRPSQPDVIRWACQLLEALNYLHTRKPRGFLHGDIKPANIMLRPNGTICLIDFNIALALNEEGAVKVGLSRGYASPEHYGISYIENRMADGRTTYTVTTGTGGPDSRSVYLDARSDIYSLGATLYHLLTGRRPAQSAVDVVMPPEEICRGEITAILRKAMDPAREKRYRSADEMLSDFLNIAQNDRRSRNLRLQMRITAAMLGLAFLAGGFVTFTGLRRQQQKERALALSGYSASMLESGDREAALEYALEALPSGRSIFESAPTAEAQYALTEALGVYHLADEYYAERKIRLPSVPFHVEISPEGTHAAATCLGTLQVLDLRTGEMTAELPMPESAMADAFFRDEKSIVFAGEKGVSLYDLEKESVVWTKEPGTVLALSGNGKRAAAVDGSDDEAVIYDTERGDVIARVSFEGKHLPVVTNARFSDPEDDLFVMNEDGSCLAVSFSDGSLKIFDTEHPEESALVLDDPGYVHFEGGFCGDYLGYSAKGSAGSFFQLVSTKEWKAAASYDSGNSILVQAGKQVFYIADGGTLIQLDPADLTQKELAYSADHEFVAFAVSDDDVLTSDDDRKCVFYDPGANAVTTQHGDYIFDFVRMAGSTAVMANRNEPALLVMKKTDHAEEEVLRYDARYSHKEARISRDGRTAVFFGIHGFRVYSMDGTLVSEVLLEDPDQIYDQQFRKADEGSWLEVTWYDGRRKNYSAEDGRLLSETMIEPPDRAIHEEFETRNYRVVSEIHKTPEVYSLKDGKPVGKLEKDAYLTYVTQVGENILTEYIDSSGNRYGLLLNEQLETLAKLPCLCDVHDDQFVFDYKSGDLRKTPVYSLEELIRLGQRELE